jgi:hypothetical protein
VLELEFDASARTVRFGGQTIDLNDANVLLVDVADNGGSVVSTLSVPAQLAGGRPAQSGANVDPFVGLIRRSPALFEFLRCDPLFAPTADQLNYCATMRPD